MIGKLINLKWFAAHSEHYSNILHGQNQLNDVHTFYLKHMQNQYMYMWLIVLHVAMSRQQLDSLQPYAYMEKKKVKYNHIITTRLQTGAQAGC